MNNKKQMKKKQKTQLNSLSLNRKTGWLNLTDKEKKIIFDFSEKYKSFLKISKTERLAIEFVIKDLRKSGFKDINSVKKAKTGDKLFKIIKNKVVIAFIVGKKKEVFNLIGSHVDSPRLDLKPNPLYEDSNLSILKTHYYGGIKKYHWVNTPLSLHGVAFTKEGKRVEIHIGDNETDPKFIIPDLLPHLSKDQMERDSRKLIQGEELNVIVGNIPINDFNTKKNIKEKVKQTVLEYLNKKYGLIEEDFNIAELEFVPSNNPTDIGFDRSLIGAYSHDDHVCVYTSLKALTSIKTPKKTAIGFFVDKEEIGSYGDTGASSYLLTNFMTDYISLTGLKISPTKIFENSRAVSADVTAGVNPNFKDVQDPRNASYLGYGISVEKYGGGGGKYSTHDAHAEYMQYLRQLLDKNKIKWQTGELGKIDIGGGGTIGMFLSRYGMDCVDAGPSVLGMHSTMELVSKFDVYQSYLFYKVFFSD